MRHGRTGNGRAAASRYYGWTPLADKEKFFAVFPAALGSPTSWKGGMASAMDSAATFARHNGCAKKPKRKDIMLGGHGWPNGRRESLAATPPIRELFKGHARGSSQGRKARRKRRRARM